MLPLTARRDKVGMRGQASPTLANRLPICARFYRHCRLRLHTALAARAGRGYNDPPDHKFKVYTGHRRRVTEAIKRKLRRRWRSNPSWATPRESTVWAETISPARMATPPTPSPDTISAGGRGETCGCVPTGLRSSGSS